jgi:hypothetical protein
MDLSTIPVRVPEDRHPVSLRFSSAFVERLEKAAHVLGVPRHTLAQRAVEAAVTAIEEASGKLVMPVEFVVRSVPAMNRRIAKSGKTPKRG